MRALPVGWNIVRLHRELGGNVPDIRFPPGTACAFSIRATPRTSTAGSRSTTLRTDGGGQEANWQAGMLENPYVEVLETFVVEHYGLLVASASVARWRGNPEIGADHYLAVVPEHQRRGLASALVVTRVRRLGALGFSRLGPRPICTVGSMRRTSVAGSCRSTDATPGTARTCVVARAGLRARPALETASTVAGGAPGQVRVLVYIDNLEIGGGQLAAVDLVHPHRPRPDALLASAPGPLVEVAEDVGVPSCWVTASPPTRRGRRPVSWIMRPSSSGPISFTPWVAPSPSRRQPWPPLARPACCRRLPERCASTDPPRTAPVAAGSGEVVAAAQARGSALLRALQPGRHRQGSSRCRRHGVSPDMRPRAGRSSWRSPVSPTSRRSPVWSAQLLRPGSSPIVRFALVIVGDGDARGRAGGAGCPGQSGRRCRGRAPRRAAGGSEAGLRRRRRGGRDGHPRCSGNGHRPSGGRARPGGRIVGGRAGQPSRPGRQRLDHPGAGRTARGAGRAALLPTRRLDPFGGVGAWEHQVMVVSRAPRTPTTKWSRRSAPLCPPPGRR